jgi:hypothetical protein
MAIQYEFEPLAELLDDGLDGLVRQHWSAIALDRDDVPLDVDWASYQAREDNGSWRAFTARRAGRLVGYVGFFLFHPERYQSTLFVNEDTIWVLPDEPARALIWRSLIREAMKGLPKPCKLQVKVRERFGGEVMGRVLENLGFERNEVLYSRFLRD